jgi:hypothetical protein
LALMEQPGSGKSGHGNGGGLHLAAEKVAVARGSS